MKSPAVVCCHGGASICWIRQTTRGGPLYEGLCFIVSIPAHTIVLVIVAHTAPLVKTFF